MLVDKLLSIVKVKPVSFERKDHGSVQKLLASGFRLIFEVS